MPQRSSKREERFSLGQLMVRRRKTVLNRWWDELVSVWGPEPVAAVGETRLRSEMDNFLRMAGSCLRAGEAAEGDGPDVEPLVTALRSMCLDWVEGV
ncbi:MAG TPA: hypothetical protein EYH34_16505 [Planctomycetes bacterium]|nr:hypothetical protein [Planctomycetota bacterium]